jgi:hypothetical protein
MPRCSSLGLPGEETRPIGKREELDAEILAHYQEGAEQERLLRGGAGRLEYLRTRELLARYLPLAPATVLDVGGGAGVYALPLAREGYSVHLIDAVPLHVDRPERHQIYNGILPSPAHRRAMHGGLPGTTRAWTRCCCWDRFTT